MLRIKLNFFESVVATLMLPNSGFIITTIVLIVSLIVKQKPIVYKGIVIAYIVCLIFAIFTLSICFIVNIKSKREFIIYNNKFQFLQHEYLIEQIHSCEYYVCKWYAIPIAFIYKEQAAGLIDIRLNSGKKIQFKIFYKDYLKLKTHIKNIVEK